LRDGGAHTWYVALQYSAVVLHTEHRVSSPGRYALPPHDASLPPTNPQRTLKSHTSFFFPGTNWTKDVLGIHRFRCLINLCGLVGTGFGRSALKICF